jgi:hypothetical protein
MKQLLNNGLIILLIIAGGYILFLRECKTTKPIVPDEIIIKKAVWDSIQGIANKPPIIRADTAQTTGSKTYAQARPLPKPIANKNTTINTYKDSLINPEINVWLNDKVKGVLLDRKWEYKPIVKQITIEKIVFVPQIVDNFVSIPKNGIFVYGVMGGNKNMFFPGAGLDFITKKNTIIGGVYQRYGNDNIFSIKLGIKLGK